MVDDEVPEFDTYRPEAPSEYLPPVAVRASNGRLQFAALLIQAFYAVPQLRHRLIEAKLDPTTTSDRLEFTSHNQHILGA